MEKVKITSEQKKSIEELLHSSDLNQVMSNHLECFTEDDLWGDEFKCLNSITPPEMSLILFFDHYEVEMTKEERLLDFYNKYLNDVDEFDAGVRHGVENTLSIYGIEIEGINK